MSRYALVTGSSGAIGSAICQVLRDAGYRVCGVDCVALKNLTTDHFIQADLNHLVEDDTERCRVISNIRTWLDKNTLDILVNNAAYQHVSQQHPMPIEALKKSYNINVIAPYLMTTTLAQAMTPTVGSVVNIGSVHSRLTKPGFVAYATTKAALASLTKGLALDYADHIRINCIEPASVETPMLLDGFKEHPEKKAALENYHPQKRISTPNEIAQMVLAISSPAVRFLHGACIDMSGGIANRLHDPA
jgi:NAD(P)-dependent dehydrogenase (short-subunit alcohol dehydrogenase family)